MLLFYRPNPSTYYTAYLDFADWTDSASFTPLKTVNFSPPDRGFTAMLPGNYNFVLFYDGDTQHYEMLHTAKAYENFSFDTTWSLISAW